MARPKSELGTSARNVRILRWLRRKPALAKVIGDPDLDEEVTCVVAGDKTQELHDVISVVRDCSELRGVDKDGNELRRLKLDSRNDPELRAEAEVERSSGQQGSVPIISVDVPKLVDSIARNIREAVNESTRNNSSAHRAGFEAMIAVVNVALNLLSGLEARYATVETLLAQRNAAPEGEETDPKRKMAMAALQQAMGGGGTNGAGGFDPTKLMQFMQSMQSAAPPNGAGNGDEENAS